MRARFPRVLAGRCFVAVLVAMCVLASFAVMFRGTIEAIALRALLARATGADVALGDVNATLVGLSVERAHVAGGGLTVDIPRARVRFGNPLVIELESPHALLDSRVAAQPDDPTATAIDRLRAAHARIRFSDASLDIEPSSGGAAPPERVVGGAGSFALDPDALAYDVRAELVDGAGSYPFSASATEAGHPAGRRLRWSAAALPVAALATLYPASTTAALDAGELRDVTVVGDDGVLTADATLADVGATVGTRHLRGLHGPLAIRGSRLGTPGAIAGTLDGAAFSFDGEVHDLTDPVAAVRDGTPHLRELLRLFEIVAAQPQLQFVRLETTGPGVAFAQYGARSAVGPRVISLVAVDPADPAITIGTALAADHVISKGERTSQLAERTGAVAGVNGDYFDIGRSYEPQGLLIRSGEIVRGPTDRAALVVDRANKVTFAEFHLNGTVQTGGRSLPITQINTWPPGEATLITPAYGDTLPPAPGTVFVRLEPVDPARHVYRATAVEPASGGLGVSFGIGFGPLVSGETPHVGDRFTLEYRLEPNVADIVCGIGGGPILLKDGAWYEDPHAPAPAERDVRWPVVALGTLPDGLLLFTAVDGRHPERAVGMTRPEFAALLQSYGVRDAMALDSGGSVTLVSRAPGDRVATVRNTPSDFSAERYISDALLVFSAAPPDEIVTPLPSPAASPVAP